MCSINHLYFKVDAQYRGDQVIVSYDPVLPDGRSALVLTPRACSYKLLKRYQRQRGAHPQPPPAKASKRLWIMSI